MDRYEKLKVERSNYKLWKEYFVQTCKILTGTSLSQENEFQEVTDKFEECLLFLYKMPRIWLLYAEHLWKQRKITATRRCFDRAIRALPCTQHHKIWPKYVEFAEECRIPEVGIPIYRRYIMINPAKRNEFIKYLKQCSKIDEACKLLVEVINNKEYQTKSEFSSWKELCRLCVRNADTVVSIDVDQVFRRGLQKYDSNVGKLWTSLAEYHTRCSMFNKARDVFDEGLKSCMNVNDFKVIYDAYSKFELVMVKSKMLEKKEIEGEIAEEEDKEEKEEAEKDLEEVVEEIKYLFARTNFLVESRDLLLNSCLLRQNPHNVQVWKERTRIYYRREDIDNVVNTYVDAFETVDPMLTGTTGSLASLYLACAKFYEELEALDNVRDTYENAINVEFKSLGELVMIWIAYCKFEIELENYAAAREIMERATKLPLDRKRGSGSVLGRLWTSQKIWNLHCDLVQNFGTVEETTSVYEQMLNLKVASPQTIINYADFLDEQKKSDEMFAAFEKGIAIFKYPHLFPLWKEYLTRFIKVYRGTKMERTRELFSKAYLGCKDKIQIQTLIFMEADFEEHHKGFATNILAVYLKFCDLCDGPDKYDAYQLAIHKANKLFGKGKARELYEKAIRDVPTQDVPRIAIQFAAHEVDLKQTLRARNIFRFAAQYANPNLKSGEAFWEGFLFFFIE